MKKRYICVLSAILLLTGPMAPAAWGQAFPTLTVVDEDIDVTYLEEVMWAMATSASTSGWAACAGKHTRSSMAELP